MRLATLAAINLPQGTDLAGLLLWAAICGGLFFLLLILAAAFEQTSELVAWLFGVPAIVALAATLVLGIVWGSISAGDWSATKQAITTQVRQDYGITLTEDQTDSLANGDSITLNDGSQVKLKFSDHKHRATLVHVNYTPVESNR